MRLLLDAHVSARRIAVALRAQGHQTRAVDEERALDGSTDDQLLALAAEEKRIMVTFNVRDFVRIARNWSESGRHHAGCLIVVGIDHSEYGVILRRLEAALKDRPKADEWRDQVLLLG